MVEQVDPEKHIFAVYFDGQERRARMKSDANAFDTLCNNFMKSFKGDN